MTSSSSKKESPLSRAVLILTNTSLSRAVLILTNTCFAVTGVLMITYAAKLNNSGWLDVFKEDLPWIQTSLFAGMIALGCITISIAGIGCVGASFKNKGLLYCYNIFVLLAFICVFLVMAGAFASMNFANDMSEKAYPGALQESAIADNFNQLYCYAEAAYICTAVPVVDLLNFIIPGSVPDSIVSSLEGFEGVNDICNTAQTNFYLDILFPGGHLTTLCQECEKVAQYEQYEAIYSWVDEQCPLAEAGNAVLSWCGRFIVQGEIGNSYDGAPYGACRPEFLDIWSTISKNIGSGMVAFLVFLLITILSACALTRRGSSTGTVQDKVPKEEGIEVVHGEFTLNVATFQSDEEQQHQAQIY